MVLRVEHLKKLGHLRLPISFPFRSVVLSESWRVLIMCQLLEDSAQQHEESSFQASYHKVILRALQLSLTLDSDAEKIFPVFFYDVIMQICKQSLNKHLK